MNRNVLEFARTGLLSAVVTTSVLLPARVLQQRHASVPVALPTQSEKLHVEAVGPLELTATMGIAVNDKNEAVGTAFGDEEVRAFIVRNGKGALLPLPKGVPYSMATSINEKGEAVGIAGTEETVRGMVWSGNKAGVLTSGKRDTVATTISSKSVAAGAAFDSQQRGFFANQHLRAMVSYPNPADFWQFAKVSMNNTLDNGFSGMLWSKPGEGKAIGEFIPQAGSPSGTLVGLAVQKDLVVPAAFKNGKIGALPQAEGFQLTIPMAANDKDIFVGAGVDGERMVKPVGWANGKTGILPVPGGKQGLALGINSENQVVGVIETANGEAHAAVWLKGKVIDLNDLVEQREGWTLVQARGINNKGFIIGTGIKDGHVGAFLVGPIR